MKRCFLSSILLLSLCCIVFGKEQKNRICRILFLERPAEAPQKLFLFDGASSQEVDLPKMNLSQIYKLRSGKLTLALLPNSVKKSKQLPEGAPTVDVPEGVVDFYLLVTSDPSNEVAPVKIEVIDAGKDKFQSGHAQWVNRTDYFIEGELGSQQLLLQPNESGVILGPPAKKSGSYFVNIGFKLEESKPLYSICKTQWSYDSRSRNIGFITMKEGVRTPQIYNFIDFRTGEKNKNP